VGATGSYNTATAEGAFPPVLGYNTITAMEYGDGTNAQTFYGTGFLPFSMQGLLLRAAM
jgi:hypothetical protein